MRRTPDPRLAAALVALAGCGRGGVGDVRVRPVDAVPTVLEVTFTTDDDVPARAVAGDLATPFDAGGTEHRLLLVGLPEDTAAEVVVEAGDDPDHRDVSDPVRARTGTLGELPALAVEGELGVWAALPLVDAISGEGAGADLVVLDPAGRPVWRWHDTSGLTTFRLRVVADGVVYNRVDADPTDGAALVHVTWDGVEEVTPVPVLAHDFVVEPDGAIVSLAYEERDGVLGNGLVRVADGVATPIWSTWDCLDPVEDAGDDPAHGWTHANALDADPTREGGFLVGLRNLGTILAVDPRDRSCPVGFGGRGGTLAVAGERFAHQHQFERTEDGLLVFDNDGAPGSVSRVLRYDVDLGAGTMRSTGSVVADPPLYSFILGDVHAVGDDLLVAWSVPGTLDRIGPDGARRGRLVVDRKLGFVDLWDPAAE